MAWREEKLQELDESAWVQLAQNGDRDAFTCLVERYWDRIYRWLYRLAHHQQAAEDLAQETFLKAFAHLNSFRSNGNFQAWLYRIAYNSFLNQRRGPMRSGWEVFEDTVTDTADLPEEEAINRESMELLAQAVERLPKDFRAAFMLRIEEGLSFREIAQVLDTTEQTARWRVYKARQRLLGDLAPQLAVQTRQENIEQEEQ